jgi:hypothetical protein
VPAQRRRLRLGRLAGQCGPVDPVRLGRLQRVGADVDVAVVCRDGAVGDELQAPLLQRAHQAGVVPGVAVGRLAKAGDRLPPTGLGRLEVAVRPERRDNTPGERRVGRQGGVRRQVVRGIVGGGQDLDAELVIQGPWSVVVLGQPLRDLVVDGIGRLDRGPQGDLEDLGQLRLQPVACGRAAERVPVRTEQPPHLACSGLRE